MEEAALVDTFMLGLFDACMFPRSQVRPLHAMARCTMIPASIVACDVVQLPVVLKQTADATLLKYLRLGVY